MYTWHTVLDMCDESIYICRTSTWLRSTSRSTRGSRSWTWSSASATRRSEPSRRSPINYVQRWDMRCLIKTVLRIREILVRIRIRGSISLTTVMDPDPVIFVADLQHINKKFKFFWLITELFEGTFTSFFKDKKSLWIMEPDPGGLNTYGSSGFGSGSATRLKNIPCLQFFQKLLIKCTWPLPRCSEVQNSVPCRFMILWGA